MSRSGKRRGLLTRLAAEFAVIVLGVLIALWADGWVAERAEREIEASRIEALWDNVRATRSRLEDAAREAEAARAALSAIARAPDQSGQDPDLVLQGFLFGPVFTPEINVYADLKSSGDLALLTSSDLRQRLARMDALLEQVSLLQSDLTTVQQLNYDPFVVREYALGPSMGPFLGLDDLPGRPWTVDADPRLVQNLALFKLDLVTQLLEQYAEVAKVLDGLEAAMD